MFSRSWDHFGIKLLDGLVALWLTILVLDPSLALHANAYELLHHEVALAAVPLSVAFVACWQFCFDVLRLYDRFSEVRSKVFSAFKGVILIVTLTGLCLHFFYRVGVDLQQMALLGSVLLLFVLTRLLFHEYLLDRLSARNPQRAIILGSGKRAGKAWRQIRIHYKASINLLGFVDQRPPSLLAPDIRDRYVGNVSELDDILLREVVDVLLVAMPLKSCYALVQEAIAKAEEVGVRVIYMRDVYDTRTKHHVSTADVFSELVPYQEQYMLRLAVKRVFDIAASLALMFLLAPVLLAVAIAVRLTSPGPVFHSQDRFGFRRRQFKMLKFRSMVQDAEARFKEVEAQNEASGPIFKMANDPRVTTVGRFIRATSLDELPQLMNVFAGDMSLVGPRPMTVRDVALFTEASLMRRFSVKPGITGLWQVNGRSSVGFDKWIEWDLAYIDNWSLTLDLRILLKTFTVVLRRSGAV